MAKKPATIPAALVGKEIAVPFIATVARPRWVDSSHTMIDVDITLSKGDGSIHHMTVSPQADTDYGLQIWNDCKAGKYGAIAPEPPERPINYSYEAQVALVKSDTIYRICQEKNIPIPAVWLEYRCTLRECANSRSILLSMPKPPALP